MLGAQAEHQELETLDIIDTLHRSKQQPQPRHTRLPHKWILRTFLGLAAIAVIVFVWRAFAGNVEERRVSPDNNVVAEVHQYTFRAATDAPETEVRVGSRFHPSSHTVFDGLSYGAEIKISWIDSHTLLIRCESCNQFHIVSKEGHWGPISIQYEID